MKDTEGRDRLVIQVGKNVHVSRDVRTGHWLNKQLRQIPKIQIICWAWRLLPQHPRHGRRRRITLRSFRLMVGRPGQVISLASKYAETLGLRSAPMALPASSHSVVMVSWLFDLPIPS